MGIDGSYVCVNFHDIKALDNGIQSLVLEKYHDKHDFRLGHGGITVIFALCGWFKRIFCRHNIKKFAEIICHTKEFYNFALGDHSDYCL